MSPKTLSNNKRIARNALFLYLRMLLTMAVSLYTSRVILGALGVEDYGIWNVVAGVVGMFSFLNASMAGCTNRFLAYELGRGDYERLQKVFSSSLTIHILIAALVLLLGETIGLWFLNEKLVIPPERMDAANIIYQMTITSCMLTITQVPYNAMIMANERMNIYAYVEMGNVCLRLAIVYALVHSPSDKLVTYGVLTLLVTFGIAVFYRFYCTFNLPACRFRLSMDKAIVKPMLGFSVWDLYGNASVMARTQGVNMLLNMFFTATMNAANGIATNVQGAVMSFAGNVLSAFRPQIVKTYANGEYAAMTRLIRRASVYTTFLLLVFTIPLLMEIDYVLTLWLKNPPPYASTLCMYVLLFNVFANLSTVLVSGVHATGFIKRSSFINGTLYLLVIPVSYLAYRMGMKAEWAYIFNLVAVCGGMTQNAFVLSRYVQEFSKRIFFTSTLMRMAACSLIATGLVLPLHFLMQSSFIRLCATFVVSSSVLSVLFYLFLFDNGERKFIRDKVRQVILKKLK